MLEQERASIIRYCLNKSGIENYYTDVLPKNFLFPSAYFSTPEFDTEYDTLSSYNIRYRMQIRIFAKDNQQAYQFALTIANSLISERNRIPLITTEGAVSGAFFRVDKSTVGKIETGVYGLDIEWDSVRTFDDIPDE